MPDLLSQSQPQSQPLFLPAPLAAALATCPPLAEVLRREAGKLLGVERVSGLSNHVFRLTGEAGSFILRVERPENRGLVDRHVEAAFARTAERLGLGPRVVFSAPGQGLMLTAEVAGARPLAAAGVPEAEGLGTLLARLHGSASAFQDGNRPPVFVPALRLEDMILPAPANGAAPADLALLREAASTLAAMPQVPPVPCHCDLVPGNILLDEGRLWLIDWEYAGWSDPAWDLAYAVLECGLDKMAEEALLQSHAAGLAGGADTDRVRQRVQAMKPVCDGISALWALGQIGRAHV